MQMWRLRNSLRTPAGISDTNRNKLSKNTSNGWKGVIVKNPKNIGTVLIIFAVLFFIAIGAVAAVIVNAMGL